MRGRFVECVDGDSAIVLYRERERPTNIPTPTVLRCADGAIPDIKWVDGFGNYGWEPNGGPHPFPEGQPTGAK